MRNATRITVSTFGAIAGFSGIVHGIGEVLQGNRAPEGIVFCPGLNQLFSASSTESQL
ncbi:MAG: hypothetical protein IBX64_07820 [Actinobacteria bacterium]|nr:hypothetical protein [Actinomycetota bacterium]